MAPEPAPPGSSAAGQDLEGPSTDTDALGSVVRRLLEEELDITQPSNSSRLAGKRVLLRADLNVPLSRSSTAGDARLVVEDDTRIQGVLPTLALLRSLGCTVVVASHLGRPKPDKMSWEEMAAQFSLAPVAARLAELLEPGVFAGLAPDCVGSKVAEAAAALQPGQILLLENTRFHEQETKDDQAFACELASIADVFINDAFGVIHRKQASVTALTRCVSEAYPGPLVRREIQALSRWLCPPQRPFAFAIGGTKVADKIGVLQSLIGKSYEEGRPDIIIVGGRMAFTFVAAMGIQVGRTAIETEWVDRCIRMMQDASDKGIRMLLPRDVLVSESLDGDMPIKTVEFFKGCCSCAKPCLPSGSYGADIGPKSAQDFSDALQAAQTILWNGPMGRFETEGFAAGTRAVATAVASATGRGARTIVGGGDSVCAVQQMGLASRISHVSTGGGASLEFIQGEGMPGLHALVSATATCPGQQQRPQQNKPQPRCAVDSPVRMDVPPVCGC